MNDLVPVVHTNSPVGIVHSLDVIRSTEAARGSVFMIKIHLPLTEGKTTLVNHVTGL